MGERISLFLECRRSQIIEHGNEMTTRTAHLDCDCRHLMVTITSAGFSYLDMEVVMETKIMDLEAVKIFESN